MQRTTARLTLPFGLAVSLLSCVLWPEGAGPGAREVPLSEALARCERGEAVLIDVRSPAAYAAEHIPGAVNVPEGTIAARAAEIRRMGRLPILYCG